MGGGQISLIAHGVQTFCSGNCSFCHARPVHATIDYTNTDTIIKAIKAVDEANYNKFEADYNKLEKIFDNHPGIDKALNVSFWGSDMLTNFKILQEQVDFCEWYSASRHLPLSMSTSTNGLAFLRPEVQEYMQKHHITTQLSHDGLGQYFRTKEYDPLDNEATFEAFGRGLCAHINCVQNFYNSDIEKNIEYFNDSLKAWPKVDIQMVWTREHDYQSKELNEKGLFNGKEYDALRGTELGDFSIRNDWDMAKRYKIWDLAHAADIYFRQLENIFRHLDYPRYKRVKRCFAKRYVMNSRDVYRFTSEGRNSCSNFAIGLKDYSNHIDSLGEYIECHVLEYGQHVEDPKLEGQEWCKTCPYYNRHLCWECGCLTKHSDHCQFLYRYNQLLDAISDDTNWRKSIEEKYRNAKSSCKTSKK